MSICLRGRNEPPELTVNDVVDLAKYANDHKVDFSSIVVPAFYGPTSQPVVMDPLPTVGMEWALSGVMNSDLHPMVQQLGDSIFNNPNQSLNVEDAIQPNYGQLQITPVDDDALSIDFVRLMSFLHEKFPELKDYLEDKPKEKEDEESTKSSVD